MRGIVEIFQHKNKSLEKIYEDKNLIVDGAFETITDILTHKPAPSAISSVSLNSVSSYTINAISLGPPSLALHAHDSRFGLRKLHASDTKHLWVTGADSGVHILLPGITNKMFTKFGGANKESGATYSEFLEETQVPLNSFIVDSSAGSFEFENGFNRIYVKKLTGQAEVILKNQVKLQFGRDYFFDIRGLGDIEFAIVSLNTKFEKKYFNFETRKFEILEYYKDVSLNDTTRIEMDNYYYPQDSVDVDGSENSKYYIYLRLPKRDLFSYGECSLYGINYKPFNSYILNNQLFDRNISLIRNGYFDLYQYNPNIPTEVAKSLGLVDLFGYNKVSPLEDQPNITAYVSSFGRVSLVEEFDKSYSIEFIASSLTGNGASQLSQTFIPGSNSNLASLYDTKVGCFNPYMFIHFDVFQASANSLGLQVELEDTTTGEFFNFSGDAVSPAGSWGINNPLLTGSKQFKTFRRYSTLIPLNGRLNNRLTLYFKANGTGSSFASYKLKNLFVGYIDGWKFANVPQLSGTIEYASYEDGYGVVLSSVSGFNPVNKSYNNVPNFGTSFTELNPNNSYNLIIDAVPLSSGTTKLGVLVGHKSLGNIDGNSKFNLWTYGGLLKVDEPINKNKSAYIGYLKYFNPITSPSAVLISPNKFVRFNGDFQTSVGLNFLRYFTPIDAGKHTLEWDFFNFTQYDEEYVAGFYLREKFDGQPRLWYNFSTKRFVPFAANINPLTVYSATKEYEINLDEKSSVDFFLSRKEIKDYLIDDNYAALTFVFYGIRDNIYNLNFSGSTYFGDVKLTGSFYPLTSTNWFESNGRTPVAYYGGSGTWNSSSLNGNLLGSLTDSIIPNSVLEYTITDGVQTIIPIYGFSAFTQNFQSNGFGLGSIQTGASPYSTYDIFVFPISGAGVLLRKIALCDIISQAYSGLTHSHIVDLEREVVDPDFSLNNGWSIYPASSTTNTHPPKISVNKSYGETGLIYEAQANNPYPIIALYSKRVKDLNLLGDRFKVSFDYVNDATNYADLRFGLLYTQSYTSLAWDFSSNKFKPLVFPNPVWLKSDFSGLTNVSNFPYNSSNNDLTNNYITSSIILPHERDDEDVITAVIYFNKTNNYASALVNNLRFYSVISELEASSIFPEFPNPIDKELQPGGYHNGQFSNIPEFFGKEFTHKHEYETFEDTLAVGAYLPATGLEFFSGTTWVSAYGNLNQYGVITPHGFILEQKKTPREIQTIFDSSAGLVISSINASSTRQVKYAITLTDEEWYVLNRYYGGIAALGLWAIDYVNTSLEYGSNDGLYGPPFLVSGTPGSLNSNPNSPPVGATTLLSLNPPYRNSFVLKATSPRNIGNAVFHTNFGSPPGRVNPNGWAVSGDQYKLTFQYRTNSSHASIVSDNFDEEALTRSTTWAEYNKTFTASGNGFNTVLFKIRDDSDSRTTDFPAILEMDDIILSSITATSTIQRYDFSSASGLAHFKTNYPLQNEITLDRVWDGSFYNTSLYNSSVISFYEPVFKLFAKKVFFPGGLQINPASNFITIIWTIHF